LRANHLDYLDQLSRPVRNVIFRSSPGVNQGNTIDFEISHINHGESVLVQDNALATGTSSPRRVLDTITEHDARNRSVSRQEGHLTIPTPPGTPSITSNPRNNQTTTRDVLGRITNDLLDLNADADGIDGAPNSTAWGEMNDTRTYNARGELTSRSVKDSAHTPTPKTATLTYDRNGNLTSGGRGGARSTTSCTIGGAWGQLVEIRRTGGSATL
jgi:hypothetical protein